MVFLVNLIIVIESPPSIQHINPTVKGQVGGAQSLHSAAIRPQPFSTALSQ